MNDGLRVEVKNGPNAEGTLCMNFRGHIKRFLASQGEAEGFLFVIDEAYGGGYWIPQICISELAK